MELVGYHDLQARSAYQPLIHKQGDRWIAYVGHHGGHLAQPAHRQAGNNGTSIVDVTESEAADAISPTFPASPAAAETGGAQMVRVCDGSTLPRADKSKVYLLRTFGNTAHEIWDVTDPATPGRVTVVVSGLAARTRTGGNATPASRTSSPARPSGARGG